MSKAVNYLGIARKAGALETGEEHSGIEVRSGRAKLLALASDASDNARSRAEHFVHGTAVPVTVLPLTKEEVSAATGRNGCSMVVFTDIGLAGSFADALYQEYGDGYLSLAEEMKSRCEKAAQRRKEAQAHERNRKHGKRRSNV